MQNKERAVQQELERRYNQECVEIQAKNLNNLQV